MKLLFAGTPDFACESLRAMVEAGYAPAAVLTQPDRPAGRGRKLQQSPVKTFATRHGIPLLQPATLRDADIVAELAALAPDLMVVAAYGLLLPQAVLDIPRRGCVNVHASLLPRWRGAAPIQAAILAGDAETGISLMQMDAGLDSGPVYASVALAIGAEETAGMLHDRLARLGGELLVQMLPRLLEGSIEARPQDASRVTMAPRIRSRDAELDWQQSAAGLARRVRAYNPHPGAWFGIDGERVKCWSARAIDAVDTLPGTVVAAGKEGIDVACAEGVLRMTELQRPGRRRVSAAEFAARLKLAGKRLH